jgi:hypothetical protein
MFPLAILSKVFEFPQYVNDRLAPGPFMLIEESRFKRQAPGKLLGLTIEVWVKLDDWYYFDAHAEKDPVCQEFIFIFIFILFFRFNNSLGTMRPAL